MEALRELGEGDGKGGVMGRKKIDWEGQEGRNDGMSEV